MGDKWFKGAKDKLNTTHEECGGKFIERYFWDDMDGVLHCDRCNKECKRWQQS